MAFTRIRKGIESDIARKHGVIPPLRPRIRKGIESIYRQTHATRLAWTLTRIRKGIESDRASGHRRRERRDLESAKELKD